MKPQRDYSYSSSLAPHIQGLIAEKRASGFAYSSNSDVLKEIDTFCIVNRFSDTTVTKEFSDAWSIQRETEGLNARYVRVSVLRQLSKYILSLGEEAYLPQLTQATSSKNPHIFTRDERIEFFNKLDTMPPPGGKTGMRFKEESKVLFRLYYCCGMRLSEPLALKWEYIDFDEGSIHIFHSKGDKDRKLWVTDDIMSLLKEYRRYIVTECSSESLLFPGSKPGKSMDPVTVRDYFLRAWNATRFSDLSNPPTIKSFRHTFVVDRINGWIAEGIDPEKMLPYLSKFLGHASIHESLYYYHQAQEAIDTIHSKDTISNRIIPEVQYEN